MSPKKPMLPGPDLIRVTAELREAVRRRVKVQQATTQKAIALEAEIGETELGRKLKLTGKNRLSIDEAFRLAKVLGGPPGWPWIPEGIAVHLRPKKDAQ